MIVSKPLTNLTVKLKNKMEFKLCCAIIVATILTLNTNIYAIPLSELLATENASSTESAENGPAENVTVNGTKKDL